MLLQSLKLKNIRSYLDQTINFPPSSALLSGDIGSGKSTLLLAIEFALFGISKPDLTGETLLRKGTASASVELSFQLEGKNITIQRNLKKAKDAINQTSGYLLINNLKKELTPSELKTEIIHLLHYPEDAISKTKNYLFRYTIYCPQEEMRFILQEAPDSRLDLLRKIFNLDKYKKVRENLEFYLKEIRLRTTVLKTRLEPLDQKKSELENQRARQEQIQSSLHQLSFPLTEIKEKIQAKKNQLKELEEKNLIRLNLENQLSNLQNLLKEKQHQLQLLNRKQIQLEQKLSDLVILQTPEETQKELSSLQKQKQDFLVKESALKTQLQKCQEQVLPLQKEISLLNERISLLEKKETELKQLERQLAEKEKIKADQEKTENNLDEIKQSFHQAQLLFSQAQEIKNKLSQLAQCPTCLQKISPEYKEQVLQTQSRLIAHAEKQLKELAQKKSLCQKQFLEISQQFDSLLKKENLLIKLQAEIANLKEKQAALSHKKEQLQELVKENNFLMEELRKLKPEDFESLSRQIAQKQELLQKIFQREELEKNLLEISPQQTEVNSQIKSLLQKQKEAEEKLSQHPDLTSKISEEERLLEELLEKEKSLLSEKTCLLTQKESIQQRVDLLIEEIDQLNLFKSSLVRLTELHHWLEEFLIKLTYTIEKQVMLKIHRLFSALFQEWFSLLVEDESFSARLDDSFTPVIEQNGYEIFFDNLSGGERTAASLSYRLALNKVINDIIQEIKTKDLLILDEPTDGFSSEQLDKVKDVLEKLNLKQTILVSHESKIESFVENVIRISKSEGVSRVI